MKRLILIAALALLAGAAGGPLAAAPPPGPARHVIGISTALSAKDFATEDAYRRAIFSVTDRAVAGLPAGDDKLIVYPEMVGTWLCLLGEPASVLSAATTKDALVRSVLRPQNLPRVLGTTAMVALCAPANGLMEMVQKAVFVTKGPRSLQCWHDTFAEVARRHRAYVCAGSILAPDFTVDAKGKVRQHGYKVFNQSAIFGPNGALLSRTKKVFLTADEGPFVDAAKVGELRVVDTPFGKLGDMICADGWFPEAYLALNDAEILLQPSFGSNRLKWNAPWGGYSGQLYPTDVDPKDQGVLTEGQAWRKYSLETRMLSTKALVGVNVFMRGQIFEMPTGGRAFIATRPDAATKTLSIVESRDLDKESILRVALGPKP